MLFKPVLPVLEYVVLYDYIKNELCINKEKPELQCNGKCHLMKEMANASDTHPDNSAKKHFSVESNIVFCQEVITDFCNAVFTDNYKRKILLKENHSYPLTELPGLFRPPIFI